MAHLTLHFKSQCKKYRTCLYTSRQNTFGKTISQRKNWRKEQLGFVTISFYPRPPSVVTGIVVGHCVRPSVCRSVCFSQNTTHVASFWYSWSLYGYFGLCGLSHKTISWNVSTCHVCFNFVGKQTNKCPCMHWNIKKHTSYGHLCPSVCMDCSFLQNTTSVANCWYSWSFCGYYVLCVVTQSQ